MTPTVTISLKEYEDLKKKLENSINYSNKLSEKIRTIKQDIFKEMFGEVDDIPDYAISVYRDKSPRPPFNEKVATVVFKLPEGRSTLFEEIPPSYKMAD